MTLRMRPAFVENLESRQLLAAGFQIEFAYEASVSAAVKSVLQQAASKWQSVITGDIPDVGTGGWGAAVDDIRITARVKAIDGAGKGLAQSRPTYIRAGNHLPIAGEIEVDSADVSNAALLSTVTHEIGHALGFGTLWSQFSGLVSGTGGTNPLFLGNNAFREYRAYGGSNTVGVPIENTGGAGTRDVHWRESTFGNELLTGFLGAGSNPLSRITVGAMADLGYQVNYGAADGYSIPGITPPTTAKGSISGKVFTDKDKDGVLDSGEVGLSGRGVYVDLNKSGNRDSGDLTANTDSNGNYTFGNLAAGTYNVRLYRGDLTQIAPSNNGSNVVTLSAGQNVSGNNFATTGSTTTTPPPTTGSVGKITGKVFNDVDHDGTLDSNETGGWANRGVYLDTNKSGYRESSDIQTTTDSNGNFTFSNVPVGTYNLRLYRGDLTQTSPGGNGYITVSVTSGGTASGKNFGAYLTAAKAMSLEAWTASTTKKHDSAIDSIV